MSTQCSQDPRLGMDRGRGPLWKQLCLAASMEANPSKLLERIVEARYAVIDRIVDRFSTKSSDPEQAELRVALESLNSLSGAAAWRESE